MRRNLPYAIPIRYLKSILQPQHPDMILCFAPAETQCLLCYSPLGDAVFPRGVVAKEGNGILLSQQKPFEKCTIKVKICQSSSCKAVNHVFPYEAGIICSLFA